MVVKTGVFNFKTQIFNVQVRS